MNTGKLFIVSAPSGAGKTSLLRALVKDLNNIEISVSYTTRAKRPNEVNMKDYYFVSEEKFKIMQAKGEFLESALVFDHYYGTSSKLINETLAKGIDVILVIDWQGAKLVKKQVSDAVSIFILPPSKDELKSRLTGRGSDSEAVIASRMDKAKNEMSHYFEYDYIVVNDIFDDAVSLLKSIIIAARLSIVRQKQNLASLLQDLLG